MAADQLSFRDLAVPGVRDLHPYQPGKPEAELVREYGVTDIVKLASNENPLGPSPRVVAAIQAAATGLHRYPEGSAYELRQALADHHDLELESLTFGNGSNDILDLVARAFLGPGREAVFARHAFAIYAIATRTVGADAVVAPANPSDHAQPYGHDLTAMGACIGGRTRVVFIANPNNPTGTWLTRTELENFLASVPPEVVVVLDEAYIDYALDRDGYESTRVWLTDYPNLIVTRTFSKAYGLAGLRIGYAMSSPEIADLLNRARHPFNVSAAAQAAALAALADDEHIRRSVSGNAVERERIAAELDAMGLRVLPSAANFLAIDVGDRAKAVNEQLLRAGVIVRPIAGYELPGFMRVTLGTAWENDRFLASLRDVAANGLIEAAG